jgi:anti-anti-sigma regulatory factor
MGAIEIEDDVIRVVGDAKVDNAAELRAALLGARRPSDSSLTVDLSAATRIDSSVVQVLVAAKRAAAPIRIIGLSAVEKQRWERLGVASHLLLS